MGLIVLLGLMLAGCSQDDAEATPAEPVAITFDCFIEDDQKDTRAANGYTGIIDAENHELNYTGFGMFASQSAALMPDLMYNQKVEYTFYANGTGNGYWDYSPVKYWPADVDNVSFCAYAPYVETPDGLPEGTTGITGMSSSSAASPYIIYARAKHPEENVDLLWGYLKPSAKTTVGMKMHHALARLRVNITLDGGSAIPVTTRVLLRRVTFEGSLAKDARLSLYGHELSGGKMIPTWTDHTMEASTIMIDHNPEVTTDSYGIIAEDVRYIDGLPAVWQPDGLARGVKTNILCMGDYPSFVYLIPQTDVSLECKVDYTLIAADGTMTEGGKATALATPFTVAVLNGNTTYDLNLNLKID